jgi:hypothetical protein
MAVGGVHTYHVAGTLAFHRPFVLESLLGKYQARQLRPTQYDKRWAAFPTKIYCFPRSWENYKEVLRVLGEEDNITLLTPATFLERFVTCRAIFVENFSVGPDQRWKPKVDRESFVDICHVHCYPRNQTQAFNLSRLCSHTKQVSDLLYRVIAGNYEQQGKSPVRNSIRCP